MDILKSFYIVLIMLIISGVACSNTVTSEEIPQQVDAKKIALSKIDVLQCLDGGGIIKGICMKRLPACVQIYSDAGKKCNSSSECMGDCRHAGDSMPVGDKADGICSESNDPCGCFQNVENGVAQLVLCVD